MCGILAWFAEPGEVDEAVLREGYQRLRHRGPDDSGQYVSPDKRAGLGFQRLAIIDPTPSGHQPMANEEETVWLIFNGEVYNYQALRPDLERMGYRFRSQADSEVVLRAYEAWGAACIERFVGQFAFVVWDARTRCVFAARDRLGIKPLYYTAAPKHLALASELKALAALPFFSRVLDGAALYDYLRYGYIGAPRTVYAGVRHLPPGHYLIRDLEANTDTIAAYWDPVRVYAEAHNDAAEKADAGETAYADQLDALLRSAVRYRLISDVPLGAFLSGGIDSSIVVALMRQVANAEVKTFTMRFAEAAFNEADYAAAIARHLETTHREFTVTAAEAQAVIPHLPAFFDEPFGDKSAIPTYLVSKLARQAVTVALSGDGGDELFAGYNSYNWPEGRGPLWRRLAPVRPLLRRLGAVPGWSALMQKRLGILAAPTVTQMFDQGLSLWQDQEIQRLAPTLLQAAQAKPYHEPAGAGMLDLCTLLDLQRYLPDDILTKVDRTGMAVSLETRVPILDHRVVEFALGLPLAYKRRNGTVKYLLRQVLRRYVPPELTDRPKQGFSVPLGAWLKGDLRPLMQDYLAPERVARYGLLSPAAVGQAVERFIGGRDTYARVWSLMVLQMWLEHTFEGTGVEVDLETEAASVP